MTDQLRQAAQQALEALCFGLHVGFDESSESQIKKGGVAFDHHNRAITALRTALEQQAEPVAYYHPRNGFYWEKPTSIFAPTIVDVPPMALYAAPQRPWVGLTPEEILDLFDVNNVYGSKWIEFARTVEAKLKALNK